MLPLLLHGDAAFAGQGIVAETLNLSGARTATAPAARSTWSSTTRSASRRCPRTRARSTYCTDVAKMVHAPVFHVNGDDPEAVVYVASLALEYRQKFKKDVVIDLVCYRRWGHNEGDEPSYTQPLMYAQDQEPPLGGAALRRASWCARARSRARSSTRSGPRRRPRCSPRAGGAGAVRRHRAARAAAAAPVDASAMWGRLKTALQGARHACPTGFEIHPKLAAAS